MSLGSAVMTAVPHWDLVGPADTDADLARAAAAGDRSAFAGIYDRYADRLHDYCVGMLRDRDDAADCVQDAFCTAAARLNQLRDADKLRPWLYAIARNEALRRLRDRRRETVSDDLPETVSQEPGPHTLAARTELADLISEAAGGLSDRDRSILELTYRHGLDGPDLAEALRVSTVNATKMVQRLRDTVERSLGALLVARRIRNTGRGCAELATVLDGWDGHFTVLMRKRIARHIESCPTCNDERQHLVSPLALLGATPVFIPAPEWLRERTLNEISLTPSTTPIPPEQPTPERNSLSGSTSGAATASPLPVADDAGGGRRRRALMVVGLLAATLVAALGLSFLWMQQQKSVSVVPVDVTNSKSATATPSATPSNPIPAPPSASPTSTAPAVVPPSGEPPTPTITYEAPPPGAADPVDPPPVLELPVPVDPPAPDVPDTRTPASDLPNDAVPPRVRSQPPAGIAALPPDKTAEQPKRRIESPPPKPPTRRAGSGLPPANPDPPR
jgi:RNA polymerase sigma factor (sigma-70 family)